MRKAGVTEMALMKVLITECRGIHTKRLRLNVPTLGMAGLGYASAPTFYDQQQDLEEPDVPLPSKAYLDHIGAGAPSGGGASADAFGAAAASSALQDSQLYGGSLSSSFHSKDAVPGMLWAEDWSFAYGKCTHICIGAWCVFITVPLLFFLFALPPLQERLNFDVTTFGLVVWALCAICYAATGMANPGVPPQPQPTIASFSVPPLPHPGPEYTISRDTHRYVRGFDHFCEFVGNDIGRGNLGCFVAFLVLLSTLATYVVLISSASTIEAWLPGHLVMHVHGSNVTIVDVSPAPSYHLLHSPWRIGTAAVLFVLAIYSLIKCWSSDACAGVGPLIMLMPGAHVGAVLVVIVLLATVLLPFTSNMFELVSAESNPTAFFLILPSLCFAVLFCGMTIHWVWLLANDVSQKLWLKTQGYKKPQKPSSSRSSTEAGALV